MVEEGRACFILNHISPLALTFSGQDNVLGFPLDNGDNQKVRPPVTPSISPPPPDPDPPPQWIPTREGENRWTLKNVVSGKFLSTAARPEPGVDLIVADSPTVWQLRPGQQGADIVGYH